VEKQILITASVLGLLSIVLGAFGAHMFEEHLSVERLAVYHTAVRYQFYHAFFLLFLGLKSPEICLKFIKYIYSFCLLGVCFFSGSLYLLCLTDKTFFGMITPIGGGFLILSWILLIVAISKSKKIK